MYNSLTEVGRVNPGVIESSRLDAGFLDKDDGTQLPQPPLVKTAALSLRDMERCSAAPPLILGRGARSPGLPP